MACFGDSLSSNGRLGSPVTYFDSAAFYIRHTYYSSQFRVEQSRLTFNDRYGQNSSMKSCFGLFIKLGGDQGVQYLVARRKECGTSHVHRRNSGLAREARMCKIAGGEGVSIGRIMAPSPAPRDHEHPGGSILNAAQITPLRRQLSSVGRCSSLDTKFHRSHKHLLGLEVEELRELNRPPGPDRLIFDKDENGLDGGGGINSDELRLDMDRSLAAEASSGAGTHSWMDMNLYSTKNAISQGLLTLALLTSNASQLRSILQNGPRANRFYLICLSAVGTALTLQVTVGILLIIKDSTLIVQYNKDQQSW